MRGSAGSFARPRAIVVSRDNFGGPCGSIAMGQLRWSLPPHAVRGALVATWIVHQVLLMIVLSDKAVVSK